MRRIILKTLIVAGLGSALGLLAGKGWSLVRGMAPAFHVVAHPDDWQLFRGEQAYDDLTSPGKRTVFIHASAGDAGRTDGWWEAREAGAIASLRSVLEPAPLTMEVAHIRGHPIVRYRLGPSTSYFLRLPDGNISTGRGYETYGFQSLPLLRDSGKVLVAVDKSTRYGDWADFCATLAAIVDAESGEGVPLAPVIHALDYSRRCNPGDHVDHLAIGDAVRTFAADRADRVWGVGYEGGNRPRNLQGHLYDRQKRIFLAYGVGVLDATRANGKAVFPSPEEWNRWGGRGYFRRVGKGSPDPADPACGEGSAPKAE